MQITHIPNAAAIQNAAKAAETPAPPPVQTPAAKPAENRAQADIAAMQLAKDAVRQAAPDFDVARVADIKDAMQRGEIRFNADKLAGFIMAIHGGKR